MHTTTDPADVAGSFGAWLRHERERRKISIASIAESTKILGALLEGLENDDLSRWPVGLYRRAFMRAYAQAIGLEPESVVREFMLRFPEADDQAAPATPVGASGPLPVLRLTLADTRAWFASGPLIDKLRPRCAATALDAAVIGLLSGCLWLAFDQFWTFVGVAACGYYFVSILVLGNTPGVCLFASRSTGGGGSRLLSSLLRLARGFRGHGVDIRKVLTEFPVNRLPERGRS